MTTTIREIRTTTYSDASGVCHTIRYDEVLRRHERGTAERVSYRLIDALGRTTGNWLNGRCDTDRPGIMTHVHTVARPWTQLT